MMFLKMLERSVSSIVPFPGDLFLDVFLNIEMEKWDFRWISKVWRRVSV